MAAGESGRLNRSEFTHLHVHSNFSFLDGGSSVEALLDRAKELGYPSLAVTDHNGLYGAVRFYKYAKQVGIKPIIGVEMRTEDGCHLVLIAKNLSGYSNLCKLVTKAHLSHEKGEASVDLDALNEYRSDLFCLSGCPNGEVPSLLRQGKQDSARQAICRYIEVFGTDNFFIEMQNHLLPGTSLLNARLDSIAREFGVGTVATNNCHYAVKEDFVIQDVLACIQTTNKLDERTPLRKLNAEYYLKSSSAMSKLFQAYPESISNAGKIADQCNLDLGIGSYRFPDFPVPSDETPYSYLCKLCFEGLKTFYKPITPEATRRLQYELEIIHQMGFTEYFLVVWEIVRYARSRGIRCSGRGSAADSMVAYCLGITIVDPLEQDLLFERFLNPERKGMPDIDIDFDSLRRDEVINFIYERFGKNKVAMVCTVSTLSARSSIREIGKAMDFPKEQIARLASVLPHTSSKRIRESMERLPELKQSNIPIQKMEALIDICEKVDAYPRHLSVHLGGLVISGELLTNLVPLEWATKGVIVTQFDKDDIEALGLVKMDILGLKNLSAIEETMSTLKEMRCIDLDIDNLPLDDPKVYELLRSTDTVGLFQIESPGMRGLLGRLQPTRFEDVVAQIALFRPGPMQADMINPFIARRHGDEPISYLHPNLETALKETYGVILYQEQVLRVAAAIANFTYGQSDSLRRAMTKNRTQEEMEKIKDEFIENSLQNGIELDTAEEVFTKLRAFAAYGFCKAHAASFGKIAYQTAYLKAHYPAEFLAGILSCQPMGFYPSNVILEEARRIGIKILGVDVNKSRKKFTAGKDSIRIGLMQVKGISEEEIRMIVSEREKKSFSSLADFKARTNVSRPTIENLINCGGFDSLGIPRRKLLWILGEMSDSRMTRKPSGSIDVSETPLFGMESANDRLVNLPNIPEPPEHVKVRMDYDVLGLSSICHPMVFYRETMKKLKILEASKLRATPDQSIVRVAGVVVSCMRPPTKSGVIVVFVTLEDETGLADVVVFPKIYEKYGKVIYSNPGLIIEGKVERSGHRGLSIIARKIYPLKSSMRNNGLKEDTQRFAERIRTVGHRSWVKGQGV